MHKESAEPRDKSLFLLADHSIIQLAIFSCAVTMVIALAVAFAAS